MTTTLALLGVVRGGFFLFGILVPLVIVGLIAYGVWELARSRDGIVDGVAAAAVPAGAARSMLDERFARGEIDAEEYVQRRTLLDGVPVTTPGVAPVTPPAAATAPAPDPAATTEQPAADPH